MRIRRYLFVLIIYGLVGCSENNTPDSTNNKSDLDGDNFADSIDCAPEDEKKWQLIKYTSVELDGDGVRVEIEGEICAGDTLPIGYFDDDSVINSPDCDDSNSNVWRNQQLFVDQDGDGVGSGALVTICTGNTIPIYYSQLDFDCNDLNETVWRNVVIYEDVDNDGIGSGHGTLACIGVSLASGLSIYGYDPLDTLNDVNSASITDFDLPVAILASAAYLADGDDNLP